MFFHAPLLSNEEGFFFQGGLLHSAQNFVTQCPRFCQTAGVSKLVSNLFLYEYDIMRPFSSSTFLSKLLPNVLQEQQKIERKNKRQVENLERAGTTTAVTRSFRSQAAIVFSSLQLSPSAFVGVNISCVSIYDLQHSGKPETKENLDKAKTGMPTKRTYINVK